VRSVDAWVDPEESSAIPPEDYPWLTLITCKGYDANLDDYQWRVIVRAVQIKVE